MLNLACILQDNLNMSVYDLTTASSLEPRGANKVNLEVLLFIVYLLGSSRMLNTPFLGLQACSLLHLIILCKFTIIFKKKTTNILH